MNWRSILTGIARRYKKLTTENRDSKKLSMKDLMDRADRTVREQKDYERTHKPRAKQNEPAQRNM